MPISEAEMELDRKFAPLVAALEKYRLEHPPAIDQQEDEDEWDDALEASDEDEDTEADLLPVEELQDRARRSEALQLSPVSIELREAELLTSVPGEMHAASAQQALQISGAGADTVQTRFAALPSVELTSEGQPLVWSMAHDGAMLYAMSGEREVLRLFIDPQPGAAPEVQMVLLAAVDHPEGQPALSLTLDLTLQAGAQQASAQLDLRIIDADHPALPTVDAGHKPVLPSIQLQESGAVQPVPAGMHAPGQEWGAQQSGRWSHGWYTTDETGQLLLQVDQTVLGPLAEGEIRSGKLSGLLGSDGLRHDLPIEIVGHNAAASIEGAISICETDDWQSVQLRVLDDDGAAQAGLLPDQSGEWAYGLYRTDANGQLYLLVDPVLQGPLGKGQVQSGGIDGLLSLDGSKLPTLGVQLVGRNNPAMIQSQISLNAPEGQYDLTLSVQDTDGVAEQGLKPNQSGFWTHGRYQTDANGRLAIQVDPDKVMPLEPGQAQHQGRISGLQSLDGSLGDVAVDWPAGWGEVSVNYGLTIQEVTGPQLAALSSADFYPLAVTQSWLPNQFTAWSHGSFYTDANGQLSVMLDQALVGALAEGESLIGRLEVQAQDGSVQVVAVKVLGLNAAASVANPLAIQELDGWQVVELQLRDADGVAQAQLAPLQSGDWPGGEYRTDASGRLSVLLYRDQIGALAHSESYVANIDGLRSLDGSLLEVEAVVIGRNDTAQAEPRVSVAEVAGVQSVALAVTDPDGAAQSRLLPNRQGLWSHGRYQTDAAGHLSIELDLDKVGAMAEGDAPRIGQIRDLLSQDLTKLDLLVEIQGRNDAALIQDQVSIEALDGWQQVALAVLDPDSAQQSALQPQQSGRWEHGLFRTNALGQLSVQFAPALDAPNPLQGVIQGLSSIDGTQQDVSVQVQPSTDFDRLQNLLQAEAFAML